MKYLYTGTKFDTSFAKTNAVDDLLAATGQNTGNLLIGNALKKHLNISSQFLLRGFHPSHIPLIEAEYDTIIIGAANFLHEGTDLGAIANVVEKVCLPCVIIGLGAQSPNYGDKINVPERTLRLMKIISERSKTLGVRGYNTAYILNDLGIKNVRVIGCPSMYLTGRPSMEIHKKEFEACDKIAVTGSANIISHASDIAKAQQVEHWLARLSYQNQYSYILQNELYEMKIIMKESYQPEIIPVLRKLYGLTDITDNSMINYMMNNMKVFFNIEDWMDYIRQFDLIVGTRFHGGLIGLLNGIPSILFTHDARTREMAELLSFPHVDIRKVNNLDLKRLYEDVDLKSLEIKYQFLYKNYIEFLDENGLKHNLSING